MHKLHQCHKNKALEYLLENKNKFYDFYNDLMLYVSVLFTVLIRKDDFSSVLLFLFCLPYICCFINGLLLNFVDHPCVA